MTVRRSVRNLVSRTEADPWNAILGRRPGIYRIPEVGHTLMNTIDRAVFERRIKKAMTTGVIFEKWAENMPHFSCKTPAMVSTLYSIAGTRAVAENALHKQKNRSWNARIAGRTI